jgi:hypothetical protein
MSNNLESVLGDIPGLAGYQARRQQITQEGDNELRRVSGYMTLAGQAQQQEERARQAGLARQMEQDRVSLEPEAFALKYASPDARLRAMTKEPQVDRRPETIQLIEYLEKMPPDHPARPRLIERIEALGPKPVAEPKLTAPPSRTRVEGEIQIQEELQPDGTWKEIGKGPRFAKQVAGTGGGTAFGATQGALDPVADKETIRNLAIESLYNPNALAGFRRDTKAMASIMNSRTQLMRESGITAQDVVSGQAGFKADMASLNKITPQFDAITAFKNTAIRNGKILKTLAEKADTTGVPVAERWIRAGRKAIGGDPDIAAFDAQMNLYRAEAARILTQPNLSGVLTDTARKEMEEVIRNSASAKQIVRVVDLLETDFKNREETLVEQIGAIRSRMNARVGPGAAQAVPGQSSAPAAAPAAPQQYPTATAPNGRKVIFKDGKWQNP